jgi:hypothetical protein
MKRLFAVGSLLIFGVLVAYFLSTKPRGDRAFTEADSIEIPEIVVLPPRETEDEIPLAGADPGDTDASSGVVGETNQESEGVVAAGAPLDDMMRFVDGIELSASIEVFEWLNTEEGRDESWAIPMESELHDYFRRLPDLASNFGVPYIHCRQTMCGIQIIGYGQDAGEHWVKAIAEMESRSWVRAEKLDTRIAVDPIRSDATGFVVYTMNITEDETP